MVMTHVYTILCTAPSTVHCTVHVALIVLQLLGNRPYMNTLFTGCTRNSIATPTSNVAYCYKDKVHPCVTRLSRSLTLWKSELGMRLARLCRRARSTSVATLLFLALVGVVYILVSYTSVSKLVSFPTDIDHCVFVCVCVHKLYILSFLHAVCKLPCAAARAD